MRAFGYGKERAREFQENREEAVPARPIQLHPPVVGYDVILQTGRRYVWTK